MRERFQARLDELTTKVLDLIAADADAISAATAAVVDSDPEAARRTREIADRVEMLRAAAEDHAVSVLALEQPVARDLRQVVSAIHLVSDLARMAELAGHIAQAAQRRHPDAMAPKEIVELFARMGAVAATLTAGAADVMRNPDPQRAIELERQDEELNDLHRDLHRRLADAPPSVCEAVDSALVGRYFERFGDHAVEVGRRTVYFLTGFDFARHAA